MRPQPPSQARIFLGLILVCLALGTLSSCSWFRDKDDDLAPPIYKPKPPVDPVEQRIFYSGWRNPN